MKTVYLDSKKKMTPRRIKKVGKRLNRVNQREQIVVAISNNLMDNAELVNEIEKYRIDILNRQMAF